MNKDFTVKQFINFWGEKGYMHDWSAYDRNYLDDIMKIITSNVSKDTVFLEIGAGAGYWTNYIFEYVGKLIAFDVIDKPERVGANVVWMKRNEHQFNCEGIESESIDFVFSYGVFCHLSNEANKEYLQDIYRVMKKGGKALLMYVDADKWTDRNQCGSTYGFHTDRQMTMDLIKPYQFGIAEPIPEIRHTLLLITKL